MKQILKILILAVIFYFLGIFQLSYLPLVAPFNFLIVLVLIINLLEDPQEKLGLYSALMAGIMLDFYSPYYFGGMALSLLVISFILKFLLSRYVRIPSLPWLPKI